MTNTAPSPADSATAPPPPAPPPEPRLLDRLREHIRTRHYSLRTERAYAHWVARYIRFHGKRHPAALGAAHVAAFLSSLANERHVAASTQNQALAALLFLYKQVLGIELPWLDGITRAKRPRRLPVVLTQGEVREILSRMDGVHALVARLMYGTGMRLTECLSLRVKDVDLARNQVVVRQGKRGKDRLTMFPGSLVEQMKCHLDEVRCVHARDRAAQRPGVAMPDAYGVKNPPMIYTHVLNRGGRGVVSPLDR